MPSLAESQAQAQAPPILNTVIEYASPNAQAGSQGAYARVVQGTMLENGGTCKARLVVCCGALSRSSASNFRLR